MQMWILEGFEVIDTPDNYEGNIDHYTDNSKGFGPSHGMSNDISL
jgi:hypothetical protein